MRYDTMLDWTDADDEALRIFEADWSVQNPNKARIEEDAIEAGRKLAREIALKSRMKRKGKTK